MLAVNGIFQRQAHIVVIVGLAIAVHRNREMFGPIGFDYLNVGNLFHQMDGFAIAARNDVNLSRP